MSMANELNWIDKFDELELYEYYYNVYVVRSKNEPIDEIPKETWTELGQKTYEQIEGLLTENQSKKAFSPIYSKNSITYFTFQDINYSHVNGGEYLHIKIERDKPIGVD